MLFRSSRDKEVDSSAIILHSKEDKIVEFDDSLELANNCGATLISVGECHRMSDEDALEAIYDAVKHCAGEAHILE